MEEAAWTTARLPRKKGQDAASAQDVDEGVLGAARDVAPVRARGQRAELVDEDADDGVADGREGAFGRDAAADVGVVDAPDVEQGRQGRRPSHAVPAAADADDGGLDERESPVSKSTSGVGRPDQTSKLSISVEAKSFRLIFGTSRSPLVEISKYGCGSATSNASCVFWFPAQGIASRRRRRRTAPSSRPNAGSAS